MENDTLQEELQNKDIQILKEEPLSKHTTFKIGGPAAMLAEVKNIRQLVSLVYMARKNNFRYMVMGNGSNILFPDDGYRGLVIKTSPHFGSIIVDDDHILRCEAGALLSKAAAVAAENGLSGLEFAQGIPGTVGGALYMNAGAYGGEIGDLVFRTCYMDPKGEMRMIDREEHRFGYRTSRFKEIPESIILYTELSLKEGDPAAIREKMAEYAARRKEKQPIDLPSAGSVFKRPKDHYAGELIERCGLKGYRVGDAMVSEKHAGFIVNCGKATCEDVLAVIEHVEKTVLEQTGVQLEREVRVIRHKK
ncbi:UDP-N-acetylmuramate dehydrogenase [Acidaminobacterium chupaoyuni]